MFDFRFEIGGTTTHVAVRPDILREVGPLLVAADGERRSPEVVVISDDCVGPIYADLVLTSLRSAGYSTFLYEFPAGESSKSLGTTGAIYEALAERGVSRNATLLALGGGVVSDLCGFVASTWMRGVRFAICPTTLEADVDACLGGKTAINVSGAKNLVGVFHQPTMVAIDPTCLKTLGERDLRAGLAESIKHALIASPEFFDWQDKNISALIRGDVNALTALIKRNLRIKGEVVAADPYERLGRRVMLNFGHTIGHALEACSGYELRHGECVALGMLAACWLSHELGLLTSAVVERVRRLVTNAGLPTTLAEGDEGRRGETQGRTYDGNDGERERGSENGAISQPDDSASPPLKRWGTRGIETERMLAAIAKDKKVLNKRAHFVLLEDVGRPVVRNDVPESMVRAAVASLVR